MRKPVILAVAALVLAACAAGRSGTSRLDSDRISREEIEQAGPSSAYDLIQKLRPIWLRKRGQTSFTQESDVVVYLDGTRLGARDSLRSFDTTTLESLEFLDARRATNRFGPGHVNGAILLRTRS
jgi:Prokaryotic membrane lipoprotein lipid attachment site